MAWLALVLLVAAPQSDDAALRKRALELESTVTDLRGLEFWRQPEMGFYSERQLKTFLREELDYELPPEKSRRLSTAYAQLGLVPRGADLRTSRERLLNGGVAGFYDPESKVLRVVRRDGGGLPEDAVLVHELVHAAQDQHFDLRTLPLDEEPNADLALAVRAVVEGDAKLTETTYLFKDEALRRRALDELMGMGAGGDYVVGELVFPYTHGTAFVDATVRARGGDLRSASALLERLPASTEQILHPEKYYGPEPDWPTDISFDDIGATLETGDRLVTSGVLGEFALRRLVGVEAAAGWDGARYAVFDDGMGRTWAAWYATWDTEEDAAEFMEKAGPLVLASKLGAAALEGAVTERRGDATVVRLRDGREIVIRREDGRWMVVFGDGRYGLLERRGTEVVVLDNVTGGVFGRAGELFAAAKKREMSEVARVTPPPRIRPEPKRSFLDRLIDVAKFVWEYGRWALPPPLLGPVIISDLVRGRFLPRRFRAWLSNRRTEPQGSSGLKARLEEVDE